jgi:hypothetical protein
MCTVHKRWEPIARATDDFFARTTLADLLTTNGNVASSPRLDTLRLVNSNA